ncbi:MAG: RluA family pseudouridine synthase [Clostridia bacterium]|nr:RluA family pseudouridine synthase [Clostridia bacterium]
MKTITVGKNEQGQRLDRLLTKLLANAGQGEVYKSLRKKKVKVNGKRITDGTLRLNQGDVLELYINDEFFAAGETPYWQSLKPQLSVVYEDAHILVMDKPAGMLSQAENEASLEGHMRAYLYQKGEFDPKAEHTFLPSLCHRIDRNTNGLVIGAKDAESLRILNQKIRDREIQKFYRCETHGTPEPQCGEITGWMKKDEAKQKMVFLSQETPGTVFCHTRYRVLHPGKTALVEAELLTGRTHQIRAGFARLGCPLLGDVKYGAPKEAGRYQHLTSYRLVFAFTTDSGCLEYLKGKEIAL